LISNLTGWRAKKQVKAAHELEELVLKCELDEDAFVTATSDDIEFLESSTPSNALVIRSLQKQLDKLKKKMLT